MHLVHVCRWNQSHVSVRVKSVRAASSHNTAESRLTSNGKKVEQNQTPTTALCSTRARCYALNLSQMPLLDNVAEFKKILRLHQDPTKETSSNEQVRVHLHTVM